MLGVIAGHDMTVRLTGDASLSRRPMGRVLGPLQEMGLEVEEDRDRLPLIVRGTSHLVPIVYELPVPSAQVKSAILLAGLPRPARRPSSRASRRAITPSACCATSAPRCATQQRATARRASPLRATRSLRAAT